MEETSLIKFNILTKSKLDSLDLSQHVGELFGTTDDTVEIDVDSVLSKESKKPVQNKVITEALNNRYTKSETYTKEEVNDLISNIETAGTSVNVNGNQVSSINFNVDPVKPVDFAESERQKSKNLFDINTNNIMSNVTYTISNNILTITRAGYVAILVKNLVVGQQYTISSEVTGVSLISFWNSSLSSYIQDLNSNPTFTATETSHYIVFDGKAGQTVSYDNIQLEEGSVATDYQPYNGSIVHEKDIANVEHIDTIYDSSSTDPNINKGYSGGIPINTTLNVDMSKYKKLIVIGTRGGDQIVGHFLFDNNSEYGSGVALKGETGTYNQYLVCQAYYIPKNKQSIKFQKAGYTYGSGVELETTDNHKLIKIEGVY